MICACGFVEGLAGVKFSQHEGDLSLRPAVKSATTDLLAFGEARCWWFQNMAHRRPLLRSAERSLSRVKLAYGSACDAPALLGAS